MTFQVHTLMSAPEAAKPQLEKAIQKIGFLPNLFGVMAEAEQFKANEQERFAKEADKALGEAIQTNEFEESANRVFEDIKRQLVKTERSNTQGTRRG